MSQQAHIQELSNRHKQVELEIEDEEKRPSPDTLRLRKLKTHRLHLQEEIDTLKSG